MRYEETNLYRLRHSAAHLLAQAVTELYPGAKLAIGPPVENGFYYDIDFPTPLREEDLPKLEQKMKELAKLDQRIERTEVSRGEARALILDASIPSMGPDVAEYKLQLLDAIPEGETISFYNQQRTDREGVLHRFLDLCRGPHVDTTKEIKAFKLMSIAGAYWRGDVKNKQLTRIYGTAFETKEELEAAPLHARRSQEARPPNPRKRAWPIHVLASCRDRPPTLAAQRRDLAPSHDRLLAKRAGQAWLRPRRDPHIASIKLYEKSGHIINYRDKMFPFMEDHTEGSEKDTYILKPMNCPFHIEIYASQMRSYRDLPVRYAEFGTVHRYEQSGEVTGILRARGFTQDDAHLFVRPDQLLEEFIGVVDLMKTVLNKLGLTSYRARLGTKDPNDSKYVGHDDNWKLATAAIEEACQKMGLEYEVSPETPRSMVQSST